MATHRPRTLAVILHADVVSSTALVQRDETLAHERIRDAFQRFSKTIGAYGGTAHELRGDALVAEFSRASDAASAALCFQMANQTHNAGLTGDIQPKVRVGISLGEVVIADGTLTGAGVVLAQRLEQLAASGGVVVQGTVSETVPDRLPFAYESLGEQTLKGFDQPVRAFTLVLADAHRLLGEPHVAVSTLREAVAQESDSALSAVWLASIMAEAGLLDEAKAAAQKVLEVDPTFTLSRGIAGLCFYKDPALNERAMANMRRAGLPG